MPAAPSQDPFPNRFADWSPLPARLLLLALALLIAASAMVPIKAAHQAIATRGLVEAITDGGKDGEVRPRDDDLKVYDAVIERLGKGENYYELVVEEHRKANYPVTPGFAVRLPTLAYISVALGDTGLTVAAFALLAAVVWAWWVRLGSEPGLKRYQAMGTALIFLGASLGLNRYYFALHELWAGMLLALAMALHRPGQRWGAALAVTALGLAIREHVLPFVLLMGALALWRRHWREAAAWGGLVTVFVAGLALHHHLVAQLVLPIDQPSPAWLVLRGLSGFLSNVVLSGNLRFLPHWIAGPAVMLMMFGWAAWKHPSGAFATLLFLGYGLAFMIAGRPDNFYWGMVIAPPMYLGLAFVPAGLSGLWRAARLKS